MSYRTGLHRLRQFGFPDNAMSALVTVLAVLTLLPYIAGLYFGPYSVPQLLSRATFLLLVVICPVLWILLVIPAFAATVAWRRIFAALIVAACLATPLALMVIPTPRVKRFVGVVHPGQTVAVPAAILTAPQRVEAVVAQVEPSVDLSMELCASLEENSCRREQRGRGVPFVRNVPDGPVSVTAFNFAQNPPVTATVELRYVVRGIFADR